MSHTLLRILQRFVVLCGLSLATKSFAFFDCKGTLAAVPGSTAKANAERIRIQFRNRIERLQTRISEQQRVGYEAVQESLALTHRKAGVPSVASETLDLMHAYEAAPLHSEERRQVGLQLKARLKVDPYFSWLEKNRRPKVKALEQSSLRRVGSEFQVIQHTGIEELIFFRLDADIGRHLSPTLIVLMLQWIYDPTLSASEIEQAEAVLKAEGLVRHIEVTHIPTVTWGHHTIPWHLVENRQAAMRNLVDFAARVEARFSYLFPKVAFENFLKMDQDDAMFIHDKVGDFWYRSMSGMRSLPMDSPPTYDIPRAKEILKRLGLPESFDPRILVIAQNKVRAKIAYAEFLLRLFDTQIPSNRGDEFDFEVYSGIKEVLALMDAIEELETVLARTGG